MEIFELASELGKKLKEDARLVRLEMARVAYEANEEIMKLTEEYAVTQQAMQHEAMKEERDDAVIEKLNARVEEIYNVITATEVYKAFEAAQNEVNELMERVNATISAQIAGDTACTHNCATCGGCH